MSEQLGVFLCFMAAGFCVAFGFHLFSSVKIGKGKLTKIVRVVLESVYSCAAFFATWALNIKINYGQFRPFLIVAFFSGCIVYYLTLKSALDKAFYSLYNFFTVKVGNKDEKNIPK